MIDPGRLAFTLKHRHSDGTWSDLVPQADHHDATDHDPERDWAHGTTIYVCPDCAEAVQVTVPDVAEVKPG